MNRTAIASGALSLAAVVLLFAAPLLVNDYWLGVLLQLLSWVALTQSWSCFSGLTGYASLGHAVFYGLGAYITASFWGLLPVWMLVLISGLVAGVFALLVGYPALRVRGPYFVILTLGLSEFVKYIVVAIEASTDSSGQLLFNGPSAEALYESMLLLAVLGSLVAFFLSHSRAGAGLKAIREDETAAATIGVPVKRLKMMAFVLSALVPGMVGSIWIMRSTYFDPEQVFSPTTSFTIITIAVIGGADNVLGPIFGAAFITLLSAWLTTSAPEIYLMLLGILLIGFVLFVPEGFAGRLVRHFSTRRA